MLASAGDDGNIILWVPVEPTQRHVPAFGDDDLEDKETWRLKHMCRSMGSEIYDLAWSPDGMFFITGSMDNVARVWNAQTGKNLCMPFLLRRGLRRVLLVGFKARWFARLPNTTTTFRASPGIR